MATSALNTMRDVSVKSPALRYHGAKFREAPWYIGMFAQHTCYVEPYGGAAGVLLQKPRSYAEVYNDLDGEVVNFFRVLQQPGSRQALIEAISHTPYARKEFERAWEPCTDEVERARRLCIRAQMGFGSAGATKAQTGFRIDSSREYSTVQRLWTEYPGVIQQIGQRFHGVLIECRPAIEVIKQHDTTTTLHFIDPPYLHSVREKRIREGNRRMYNFEMTDQQHEELLTVAREIAGMAVICGYDSDLYNDLLRDWYRSEKQVRCSAGRGAGKRKEIAWINPAARHARNQQLFS